MSPLLKKLEAKFGADRLVTDPGRTLDRRHDYWVLSHLDDIQGRGAASPLALLRPRSVEEVADALRLCSEAGVPVIPFGLGSGVCGGVLSRVDRVMIDLSQMNRTRSIDETNLLASFDAGKNGREAEREVAERGLTIGHWPQSIALSSVGGWVATRASGQLSTGYGNIEDIIYAIEAVLPEGTIAKLGKAPRAAAGPDLRHIMLGSEGTLGIITGVTLQLRRAPERQAYSAFHVPALGAGIAAQREIIQSGWAPVVMRQYDGIETRRSFAAEARGEDGLLIIVHEGPKGRVAAELEDVRRIAVGAGLAAAPDSAVAGWMERRNHVPHWKDFLEKGIILDTVEISGTWTEIERIYDRAIQRLRSIPDMLNASAHSSHVYRSGLNLYFTFAARPADPAHMADRYRAAWTAILEATAAEGGGIAHHHGIGRVRRDFLGADLGPGGLALLRRIKAAIDPKGIMNPEVLIPDG